MQTVVLSSYNLGNEIKDNRKKLITNRYVYNQTLAQQRRWKPRKMAHFISSVLKNIYYNIAKDF
jgi:hypothetical protein